MADDLAGMGMSTIKIFSEAGTPHLSISTPHHPKGRVRWEFHVAPVIAVRTQTGSTELRVLDPSMNLERPLSPEEWFQAQTEHVDSSHKGLSQSPQDRSPPDSARYYFTDRYRYIPTKRKDPDQQFYSELSGSFSSYEKDMMEARQVLEEKLSFEEAAETVKDYMKKKGLWQ